jgi:LmeA-like phospholipid-binding
MPVLLAVGLAALGLVLLDRVVLLVAWAVAARRVRGWLPPAEQVSVRVGGFPILVGLAQGWVHTVRLTARDVQAEGVRLAELRVEARGVALRRAVGEIQQVRGCGLIEYPALSAAAPGVTLSHGGNGTLCMTAGVGVLRVSASARPSISDDQLRLDPHRLTTRFVPEVPLHALPTLTYRLRELPRGLVFEVEPGERGLQLHFAGTGVAMR